MRINILRSPMRWLKNYIKAAFLFLRRKDQLVFLDLPALPEGKDLKNTYPLYWPAENMQYYGMKLIKVPFHPNAILKGPEFATLPLDVTYEEYFNKKIKSAERALIRKAIKNGFTVREIAYDDYLDEIAVINTSKDERCGKGMIDDYVHPVKRDCVVKPYNPNIYTFGCFNEDGVLVAYYMFERFTNYYHTVKGIGHSEYLSYGIMNYLFAYSVGELHKKQTSPTILMYGLLDNTSGLSKFKKHAGCVPKQICLCGNRKQMKQLLLFNSLYKLHDDTALNLIRDYVSSQIK